MKSKAVFFIGNKHAEIREIDISDPEYDEIQTKTLANGICMAEVWSYNQKNYTEPFIPGHEGIGIVTKVGKGVSSIKEGDLINTRKWQEYENQKENSAIKLTCNTEHKESYLVEPASCAVNAAYYSDVYPGDRAILFGAGYMGLLLLQLLGKQPFTELIVVDMKRKNLDLALQYGASEVINLKTEEGRKRLNSLEEKSFDITYECSAARESLDLCTKLARRGGTLALFAWHHQPRVVDTTAWHLKGLKVLNLGPSITADDRAFRSFERADRLMSTGKLDQKKLVTHVYTLDEIDKGMQESTLREEGFIKSSIIF